MGKYRANSMMSAPLLATMGCRYSSRITRSILVSFQRLTVSGMNTGCSRLRMFLCASPSIAVRIRPSKNEPSPSAMKPLVKLVASRITAMTSSYLNRVKAGRSGSSPAIDGTPRRAMKFSGRTGDFSRISRYTACRSMSAPR
ncbi:hypothetical protein D3C72_1797870 [compost metagenome]